MSYGAEGSDLVMMNFYQHNNFFPTKQSNFNADLLIILPPFHMNGEKNSVPNKLVYHMNIFWNVIQVNWEPDYS